LRPIGLAKFGVMLFMLETEMKTLNDYFEGVFCVNLEKRSDRWATCKKEFTKHNIVAQRYSAVDGKSLNEEVFPNLRKFETPGQLGCLLSQYNVIKIAKMCKYSSVLIMEDDVEFCDDFNEQLELKMQDVPEDWDMLFFGANHILHPIKITDNVYRMTRAYSAHCYAIKDTVYDTLLESLSQFREPLDVIYANLQPTINSYVINPHLVWQRPGYSDICELNVDYRHVHKVSF
jgi:GR25 family glycosyltransferase involved in LPS biosynthesis